MAFSTFGWLLLLVCSAMGGSPVHNSFPVLARMKEIGRIYEDYESEMNDIVTATEKKMFDEDYKYIGRMNDYKSETNAIAIDIEKETNDVDGRIQENGYDTNSIVIVTEKQKNDEDGYYLDPRTDSYYKLYHELYTWFEAQTRCLLDGGHLAVINSQKEALVLAELFAKHPPKNNYYDQCAYIGFLLFQTFGPMDDVWITVLDFPQTLEDAGYSLWGYGEPNNAATNEFYGCMLRDGRLNDETYNKTHPFICEKPNLN